MYFIINGKIGIYIRNKIHQNWGKTYRQSLEKSKNNVGGCKGKELHYQQSNNESFIILKKYDSLRSQIMRNANRYGKFIRVMEDGEVFGEKALLSEDTLRMASVIALTPVDCMIIDKKYFASIKDLVKQISQTMIKQEQFILKLFPAFESWSGNKDEA